MSHGNEKDDHSERPPTANTNLRQYSPPRLLVYGPVRELTAGGSGAVAEGMAMTNLMRFP